MFKNMKIGMRLGVGFGLVLLLLSIIALIGITRLAELNAGTGKIANDRMPKLVLSQDMAFMAMDNARIIRNMILITDDAKIAANKTAYDKNVEKINETVNQLDKSINTEKGQELLNRIKETRVAYIDYTKEVISLGMANRNKEAIEVLYGEKYKTQAAYIEAIKSMVDFQRDSVDGAAKKADETYAVARNLMIMLGIAAALLGIGIAFWVTRSITKPVNEAVGVANQLAGGDLTAKIEVNSSDETGMLLTAMKNMVEKLSQIITEVRSASDNLSSASEEVSATAQSMSQATSEQAASVEETSASIEQMSASIAQNTENAKVTDGMASKSAKEAAEGGKAVEQTVSAMKQIASKIGIIDDIAYQTNLLALNAAIEAARAGEHGKGFAVVAAEVRKLAERSQVAAQEIGELSGSSVEMAGKAGKLLDEMLPSINKTSDLVQEITAASEEQSSGVGQINTAMSQLNQITQQNASSSEELAATAEEMSSQAEQLQQVMSFFRVEGAAVNTQHKTVSHKAVASGGKLNVARSVKMATISHAGSTPNEAEFVKF